MLYIVCLQTKDARKTADWAPKIMLTEMPLMLTLLKITVYFAPCSLIIVIVKHDLSLLCHTRLVV